MIINIDDTTNLKRIILEFDESSNNSDEEINIINSNSNSTNKTIKPKSRKTAKQDTTYTSENIDNTDVPIDFNNYLESTETSNSDIKSSQEIIQKPVIPDIDRDVKIADNMQNLKI